MIHRSNQGPHHFTEGFTDHLEEALGVRIRRRLCYGDIHVSKEEREMPRQVEGDYWIVVNGGKFDFTAKWWSPFRMQAVVRGMPHVKFVQVGELGHQHWILDEPNVEQLLGRTDVRQLIRLVYWAKGVICPVTFLMHLAAAVPMPEGGRRTRPCIVLAGGREPARWEAYTNHAYLHTCGMLPCCDNGGCWKSRILPLCDGDEKDKKLCLRPVKVEHDVTLPECLAMIEPRHVIEAMKRYGA